MVLEKLNALWKLLRETEKAVLILDYDGTLAPFKVDRSDAVPYLGVKEILDKIHSQGKTRIVIVSGRDVKDIIRLLDMKKMPEIWGSHGMQRMMPDGSYESFEQGKSISGHLLKASSVLKSLSLGQEIETKPFGIAVHWRGLDAEAQNEIRIKSRNLLEEIEKNSPLELHEFDGGIELKLAVNNKGDAVREILSEESQGVAAAYLGDDLTDEDAFSEIKKKGTGVLVSKTKRETNADFHITPPDELTAFLNNWHDILNRKD